jgi:DNA-binding transcriptional ArsR family regulator
MTPEEFTAKLDELRAAISDKVTDLEENPKWGSQDERLEIVHALEELVVQVEALIEALEEEAEDGEDADEE